ncbi:MAG: ABC transporter ATP-binding protein [Eubacteriales bacterium]|nr:ABC transporter ATP-binding protein [Eubacteriales bacterium]MDD3289895.1 ABC transporter ATP-binding protein [Eubacteriales bacterium]MDD3864489.1 ABC transporter ATP-binding protein [Eubacteriales bacterium]MDD4445804.1 ABC transporter ATP-binding protein [Eubacteriales bacterium]
MTNNNTMPAGQTALVEIANVTKTYQSRKALSALNLNLEPGHIVGLLGPNGSGKTTLMKILTGVLKDYTGTVTINGETVGAKTKALVSYLPDVSYFSAWMRPIDVIALFKDFYADFDEQKCLEMVKRLGLDEKQRIKTMSKGTIEKFQLCLVMSRNALLYVLDEPIGGVDPAARDYILSTILSNYNEAGTIFISTHLISDVEKIFDTVVFLKEGEVVLHGEIDEIRQREGKSIDELFREVFKC